MANSKHLDKLERLQDPETKTEKVGRHIRVCFSKPFKIGEGSYGTTVYTGLHVDGTPVAVKRIVTDSKGWQIGEHESKILELVNSKRAPHVVTYRYCQVGDPFSYIVLNLYEQSLADYVKSQSKEYLQRRAPAIIREILTGLCALHYGETEILHMDLKPQNVLVDVDGHMYLADFGISRTVNEGASLVETSAKGTCGWLAAESLQKSDNKKVIFGRKSDIQVVGMISFYVLTKGGHPFGDEINRNANIIAGNAVDLDWLTDPKAWHFVSSLICHKIDKRPDAKDALKDLFLRQRYQRQPNGYRSNLFFNEDSEIELKDSFLRPKHSNKGGLYKQNQSQSPMKTSCDAKKKILNEDLKRMFYRYDVAVKPPSSHPMNSVTTMRLLAATPVDSSSNIRQKLTHALFSSYWQEDKDVTCMNVLQDISRSVGWDVDVENVVQTKGKVSLIQNTQEALNNGAFGVPSFVVNDKLFWGVDNMHLVERALGNVHASPLRLVQPPSSPQSATLTIYHDLSSPWSFLGSTQIRNIVNEVKPVNVKVEWIPIVVGSLFKQIGTPVVPMRHLSPSKLAYLMKNVHDWCEYHGVEGFRFPSHFPLRTVLPLRVLLANNEPTDRLQAILYKASWIEDQDIGNEEVLREILRNAGYDADQLIIKAKTQEIKDQLRRNTDRAVNVGLCGVPSYQVNGGAVIWGQDRLNVVVDMLCGWKDPIQQGVSKL